MAKDNTEKWQNLTNSLKEGIVELYKSKDFSDVTFTVGTKEFKAHKLILASRCTEFSRLLMEPYSANDIIIEEESITETGFEILLRFIYTDTLGTQDKMSIVEAYVAAKHYKQKKMIDQCKEMMDSWSLTEDDVCEILNVSLGIIELREKCLNFIKRNARQVVSSASFFKLNYAAMDFLLEKDALKDVELVERITKVLEWGKKQLKNPDNIAAVRDYFLRSKPALLSKIKIEELQLQDLNLLFNVRYENLLLPNEITKFMNFTHSRNREILPEWYKAA